MCLCHVIPLPRSEPLQSLPIYCRRALPSWLLALGLFPPPPTFVDQNVLCWLREPPPSIYLCSL